MDSHLKHWDIYIRLKSWETSEDLIIVSPFYWSERNFLCGFLPLFEGFFHGIFGVPFFWLNVLDYHSLFLLCCYYCWVVVIIVEESFNGQVNTLDLSLIFPTKTKTYFVWAISQVAWPNLEELIPDGYFCHRTMARAISSGVLLQTKSSEYVWI